ncbi:hypothetical protein CDN99_06670 [Roseateles aquatilis]|uniref:Uncharacterized protein n=1 Tax=Roseateles aquatilis TaxID=431061 RepID=A0A246JHA1_9BURK|nr:hypothetical protein [Roseateles aquatilis]OWQ92036.1 hypothetical protein CDN99_06670 [Roseateles aquatilis]
MAATLRQLARTDPAWQSLTRDQRLLAAGTRAMQDIQAEAARKVANAQRQAIRTAETENRIQGQPSGSRTERLVEDMNLTHAYIDGIKRDATRNLMDLINAAGDRQGASGIRQLGMVLFDVQNPVMTRDIALEVFAQGNGGTGNAAARAGAQAWLQVTEALRQRFNGAGGDVGRLDYGYLPQAHDQVRVLSVGRDVWANQTLPLLDRSRYLHEDGRRMTDAEVLDVLRGAWETISSDGANQRQPGQGPAPGSGARANRGSESRQIHFRDGESYLAYLGEFGRGSMFDAMIGHLGGMARDIGLVERYGPNPNAQMRLQFDLAQRADGKLERVFGNQPDAYWALLSGTAGTPANASVANIASHIRNIETFGKLQGAVLASVTDLGTYFVTTGFNKLSYWDAVTNLGRAGGREAKDFMNAHGMIAESMISDLNRWTGENVAQSWSGRIGNATMRLSLMNAWTDTLRRAFQLTHMAGVGRLAKTDWPSLSAYDRWRMESKGLTQAEWDVIRSAQPVQFKGQDMITPDAIYATGAPNAGEVVAKYLGMLSDESETAVLNPDLATRAIGTWGAKQAGTLNGELARAVMQFKSFPIAMMSRHWRRMLETPQGLEGAPVVANRLAYAGAMMASLSILGAVAFQIKQLVTGKDPVDMTTGKFWTRAMAQGGGLGFFGDMLLSDTTEDRGQLDTLGRALLGPTFGSAADAWELTKGNIDEAIAGKDTHAGAEALRFARGHLPLVNLWYAKAALDHAGLQALQDNLSPGYLSRMRQKARKDWQQDYWWQPGSDLPDRAPSFEQLAGR